MAPLPPQPLDCEHSSPSAHLKPDWPPTPETSGGCAPGAEATCPTHRPKAADPPAARDSGPKQQSSSPCNSGPELQKGQPHDSGPEWWTSQPSATLAQSSRSADQQPGYLRGTTPKSTSSEKLLPSPCTQSPTGPTGSLGRRQNTQQRGATGLGETAFPGKTRPSRGLNYPRAAPRAPSI